MLSRTSQRTEISTVVNSAVENLQDLGKTDFLEQQSTSCSDQPDDGSITLCGCMIQLKFNNNISKSYKT